MERKSEIMKENVQILGIQVKRVYITSLSMGVVCKLQALHIINKFLHE